MSESPPTNCLIYVPYLIPSGKSAFGIMVRLVQSQYPPKTSLDVVGLWDQSSSSSCISVKIAPLALVHRKEDFKTTLAARCCLVFFSCRSHIPAFGLHEKSGWLALSLVDVFLAIMRRKAQPSLVSIRVWSCRSRTYTSIPVTTLRSRFLARWQHYTMRRRVRSPISFNPSRRSKNEIQHLALQDNVSLYVPPQTS